MTAVIKSQPGIPENLSLEAIAAWVKPRVSAKRFQHIQGVVDCAGQIAQACGTCPQLAQLAAWLHDACKEIKPALLLQEARKRGLEISAADSQSPHLLHGPVAALIAQQELKIEHPEVLDAISQHTLGHAPMSKLAQVVFLADCLEPGRPASYTAAIWQALDMDGNINLDAATLAACDSSLQHLLATHKPIHPKTVEVRNYYLHLRQTGQT